VYVRSKSYLETDEKQLSKPMLVPLVACECFKVPHRMDHIASHPSSWYAQHVGDDESQFVIIVQLQVTSIGFSFVSYHVHHGGFPLETEDAVFNEMFRKFVDGDDKWRDQRLKLIPRTVHGPFVVQKAVENRPCLLGLRVKHRYFRGKNYLEIDSEVDKSLLSRGILKLCHRFAKYIVADMCWVIQGDTEEELPERVVCGCTVHRLDFSKVGPLAAHDDQQQQLEQEQDYIEEQHEEKKKSVIDLEQLD
jgi:hypothetical protein